MCECIFYPNDAIRSGVDQRSENDVPLVARDGMYDDVRRKVGRAEDGEPIGEPSIGNANYLSDFIADCTLGVGRDTSGGSVCECGSLGVADYDDFARTIVLRGDLRNAIDGVGKRLEVCFDALVECAGAPVDGRVEVMSRVVLEFCCHDGIRNSIDPRGEIGALVEVSPLASVFTAVTMDQDDRVALAEGVVHTCVKATFVLGQPDVLRDTLAGVELAGDVDDVRGRRLRRRDRESHHEQEGGYEHRKYACAPSIHRSHSLSERVSLLALIDATNILIYIG